MSQSYLMPNYKPSLRVIAAAELERRRRRRENVYTRPEPLPEFPAWLSETFPSWEWSWRHLQAIYDILASDAQKVMIFMPPRHGKSETVTVRYSAYSLLQDPARRVIIGGYSASLSTSFSRKVKRIVDEDPFVEVNAMVRAGHEWETIQGGGMYACGVGTGVTGRGGDIILVDDPIKSRAEANSVAYRQRVWDWWRNDLLTRREPGARVIVILTRWHEDDLAGRILRGDDADSWTVLSLPALALENDPLGREVGEALCPERFTAEQLREFEIDLGPAVFSALYQQDPRERVGGLFAYDRLQVVDALPDIKIAWVRAWDLAATKAGQVKGDPDWTVGVKMGYALDGSFRLFVGDVQRFRLGTHERNERIKAVMRSDGPAVRQRIEQEGGSSGKDQMAYLAGYLAAHAPTFAPAVGDKVMRAQPFSAQVGAGNVYLLRGNWNDSYRDELTAFPMGVHDDQVDASSGAYAALRETRDSALGVLAQATAKGWT